MERRFRIAHIWMRIGTGIGIEGYVPKIDKKLFFRGSLYVPEKIDTSDILKLTVETLRENFPDDFLEIKGKMKAELLNEIENARYSYKPEYLYNGCQRLASNALKFKKSKINFY